MVVRVLNKPRMKNAYDKKQAKKKYEREKRTRPENYQQERSQYLATKRVARKFVAIDSEGVSFGEKIAMEPSQSGARTNDGDLAQKQRTIFWGAASEDSAADWLNGDPYCTSTQIIEWLLSLREKFGDCIFVWFGSSYDATQIFCELPFEKAWELQHGKSFCERHTDKRGAMGRLVFWKRFGLSYIKQKCLKIGLLADPDHPRDEKGRVRFHTSITIYDVFGFFQTSFLKAASSIPGSMLAEEKQIIEDGKKLRGDFALTDRAKMQIYTAAELHVLARMMEKMRASMEALDIHLTRWQGAGSIAAALMKKQNSKRHFYEIRTSNLEMAQEWAHRAFFGGRIECMKQGRTNAPLYSYDVRSAYPYHMSSLPSMINGRFEYVENPTFADVRSANVLSMFRINFCCGVDDFPSRLNQIYGQDGPDFYPLPYRDSAGRITYPPRAYGIYMAEEARGALLWSEHFQRLFAQRARNPFKLPVRLQFEAGLIFHPDPDQGEAFSWLRDMYQERRNVVENSKKTGVYDLTEKILKLGINSVYGKTAQSVGSNSAPPSTACPWYAAAITAGTRAQILRAAIDAPPRSIIAIQTDGIVSTRRLGLCDGPDLGQWETENIGGKNARASLFVQPGVYHFEKNEKPISKHRGIKMDLLGYDDFGDWLDRELTHRWAADISEIEFPYRYYVTLGAATASRERWQYAGFWVDGKRELKLDNLGFKRAAPMSQSARRARAERLVDTIPKPAYYHHPNDELPLSEPHRPEWLDDDAGLDAETAQLNEEIALARD